MTETTADDRRSAPPPLTDEDPLSNQFQRRLSYPPCDHRQVRPPSTRTGALT